MVSTHKSSQFLYQHVAHFYFQAYFVLSTTIILLAIFGVAFSTVTITSVSEQADNSGGTTRTAELTTAMYNGKSETTGTQDTTDREWMDESGTNASNQYAEGEKMFSNVARDKVLTMENADSETRWFLYIEHFTNVFFSIELIFRLVCCPSLSRYFCGCLVLSVILSFSHS